MATAWESASDDTPKTANGRYLISEYKGSSRWDFISTVQYTPPSWDPVDLYDRIDVFAFSHLPGLKKVSWNMSFLTSNPFNFDDPAKKLFGGEYEMTITPGGAFKGSAVQVNVKTGYANYQYEWNAYNDKAQEIYNVVVNRYNELFTAGLDTSHAQRALNIIDDIFDYLNGIAGASSAKLDEIEAELKDARAIPSGEYESSAAIQDLLDDIIVMTNGWDILHYYLGGRDEEVFLKEMNDRITWNVKGAGAGYVSFSGGVTIYNSLWTFDYAEANVPQNWFLEVQSEKRLKGREAFDPVPDVEHAGTVPVFDPSVDIFL